MNSPGLAAPLVASFVCVVLSFILLFVLFRGARGIWRKLYPFLGPDGLRPVSFLIVSPLLLTMLLPGLQEMLVLGCVLVLGVPASFVQREAAALSAPVSTAGQAHASFSTRLVEAFATLTHDYSQLLLPHASNNSTLLLKLVLFLVLWGAVGHVLKVVIVLPEERSTAFEGADARSNFEALVKKLRSWQPWLALGGLLSVGLYLTLASIAGIGELNAKPSGNDPDVSPSGLRQALQNFQPTEERLAGTLPKDILPMSQPFQALLDLEKAALSQPNPIMGAQVSDASSPPPSVAISSPPTVTLLPASEQVIQLQQVQRLKQKREGLKDLWEQLRLTVISEERNALELALEQFKLGSYPMPYPERVQYYLDILGWYEKRSSQRQNELRDCSRSVQLASQDLDTWAEAVTRVPNIELVVRRFDSSFEEAGRRCAISRLDPVPVPTPRSARMRVVFLPMSWIRESRSVAPALIIGMIGVGLLGSVVSSFIQSPRTSSREQPGRNFPEMTGVVLRGLSAALVVFLLVQASLSTFFNQQNPSPNPYVVLFLCLVAAVFSKNAWAVARKKFTSYVGDSGPQAQPPPPPPPPPHQEP